MDELVELGGTTWRFVDTAGIRRRFRENQGADYYAALRTAGALDRAEVAVVLVDASEPLTEQDLRIVSMVIEAGRALVIAYNKWDLVDDERQRYLDREIDRQLHTARWAPRVNISAATGRHVERLVPALETALDGWETRVSTGRLNAWLTGLVAATPPPVRGGRQPKILFATQAGVRPPHFVLFTSGFLEAAYRRFIERRLREEFGFEGSPGTGVGPGQSQARIPSRQTPRQARPAPLTLASRTRGPPPTRPHLTNARPSLHPLQPTNAPGGAAGEGCASASATGLAPAAKRSISAPDSAHPSIGSAAVSRVSVATGSSRPLATSTVFPNRRPRKIAASAIRQACGNASRIVATCLRTCASGGPSATLAPMTPLSRSARRAAVANSTEVRLAGVRPPANTSTISTSNERGQPVEFRPGIADADPDPPTPRVRPPERQIRPDQVDERGIGLDGQLRRTGPGGRDVAGQGESPCS